MTKRVFISIIAVSFITFFCCAALIMGSAYSQHNGHIEDELKNEAEFLSTGVELSGEEYLEAVETEHRLTLIDGEGRVLFDNKADFEQLDNHKDREEVAEAMESGFGASRRYSGTLTQKTVYHAVRLSDGSVLRVSAELQTFGAFFLNLLPPLLLVLAGVMIVCALIASSLARKIVKPINSIDIEDPRTDSVYKEISPLIHRFMRQNDLIRRQMDDLKRRQEEFVAITENMAEGLILTDKNAHIISFNKCAERMLSKAEGSFFGDVCSLIKGEDFAGAVHSAIGGHKSEVELRLSGNVLQIFANPVVAEKEIAGAVIVILDITEKSHREDMRREFTSNVSHELKTPLTSIYGISEMMMSGIVKAEDMVSFAESIHKESGRLIDLVNDIMKLSRLDEREGVPGFESTDLYALAKATVESLYSVARSKEIELVLLGESVEIYAIPTIVSEMIYNLCDNGIKYNRIGGKVEVTVRKGAEGAEITVSDTGIGIPAEHTERIFERFYRVDKSHSGSIEGTGLGLSIVKHGAAVHNARIKLESTEGVGTKISICF